MKRKRIAINLIPFSSVQGTEIFSQNIISNLLDKNKNNDFVILISEETPGILNFSNVETIKIKKSKKYGKAFYQQGLIYSLLRKHKIDFLFSPSPNAPFFYKNKVVVIHDCAYDRFKEFENFFSKIYFQMMYYGAKYFSKKIITVSEFSKKELIDLYKINPNKIEVLYEGVPKMKKIKDEEVQTILDKLKVKTPYFFYIGNRRPRKNLIGLLDSFKLFQKVHPNYYLVMAGKKEKRFIDLEGEIKKRKIGKNVILTGFVSKEEKTALYKGSEAFVFPSFYEGFGLPVLEAQSLGIPVLTSNISSLPEVAGEAALYIDPYDKRTIAYGLEQITLDNNLRNELIEKGFQNVKRFSWERSVQQLLNLFNSL